MRRKLKRLIRFNTEQFAKENKKGEKKDGDEKHQQRQCKQKRECKQKNERKQLFKIKSINFTFSENFKGRIQNEEYKRNYLFQRSNQFVSKQNFNSQAIFKNLVLQELTLTFSHTILRQITAFQSSQYHLNLSLQQIINICHFILQKIYSYNQIQQILSQLNQISKLLGSKSFLFQTLSLIGFLFFIYGNYSLSIFYFDKALKNLQQRNHLHLFQRIIQTNLYRSISKIFLMKNEFNIAKQFAYKYLRNAWYIKSLDEQLNSYDLLGKIYNELQQKEMSIYFHYRMCKGEREGNQIIKLSNYEIQRLEKEQLQLAVYETIEVFIQKDKRFHELLQDRYKMKNRDQKNEIQIKNERYFQTHRSPNRNLNTYRILERRLIEEKKSKELHFIKPRQTIQIRKLIGQYVQIIDLVKEKLKQGKSSLKQVKNLLQQQKKSSKSTKGM